MRITFNFLIKFARKKNIHVERKGRTIIWWYKDSSTENICNSVLETYNEIYCETFRKE